MESFNNNDKRTIALGMPPLPPTSETMTGQSSQKPNIDPQKLKRTLANRRNAKMHHLKQISKITKLEQTVHCLEGDIARYSMEIHHLKRQRDLFLIANGDLKQKLGFRSLETGSKKAEYVELKKEKDELQKVYVEQQLKYEEVMKSNMADAQFMVMDPLGHPTYNFM
ncbi:basic leucine zipper 19-like [Eucalyptus grandis]|uniref:basic leucine zipper 19-like n=1 Tax=Eucalyptus grandis TaxID=71139 RepID=UPI0005272329|nr:basic leucine zipper 19-like [Eucalyptus grandis]